MKRNLLGFLLALALVSLSATAVHADYIFDVSVDTSGLSANYTAPFGIDFQLFSGGNASGNTATISNFAFGGGSPVPPASGLNPSNPPSGDLSSTVVLNTSPSLGLADFNEGFTPGTTLTFRVDLTTNVGTPNPDSFTFYILQSYSPNNGTPIPTTDTFASSLITVDITSSTPPVQVFAGLNGVPPAPTITPLTSVPEPASLSLFVLGLGTLAAGRRWQRRRQGANEAEA